MLKSILKWPGGKSWFVKNYPDFFPRKITGKYIEPFVGGGSVFFYLRPEDSILNDVNSNLIDVYQAVKDNHKKVLKYLNKHNENHSEEYYYTVRDSTSRSAIKRASNTIYLNRTCFNGIYRVNKQGKFNVPIGDKNKILLESDNWEEWSTALKKSDLYCTDFEEIIDISNGGDFLFVDPPYTVHHNNNGFVKYNEIIFSWEDQIRLSKAITRASKRGVKILMTNAYHDSVCELYGKKFRKYVVSRFSSVSAKSSGRRVFDELIIKNF